MITREQIQNSDAIWVYGDNLKRAGDGGQAKVCRGLPNTIGIPTKYAPNNAPFSFFYDLNYEKLTTLIREDIDKVKACLDNGKQVYIFRGIGEGLAQLPLKAPKIYEFLVSEINSLIGMGAKWVS